MTQRILAFGTTSILAAVMITACGGVKQTVKPAVTTPTPGPTASVTAVPPTAAKPVTSLVADVTLDPKTGTIQVRGKFFAHAAGDTNPVKLADITEGTEPSVELSVRGKDNVEPTATLKPMKDKTTGKEIFGIETVAAQNNVDVFQPFSVAMKSSTSLKADHQLAPETRIALPRAVFVVKDKIAANEKPTAAQATAELKINTKAKSIEAKFWVGPKAEDKTVQAAAETCQVTVNTGKDPVILFLDVDGLDATKIALATDDATQANLAKLTAKTTNVMATLDCGSMIEAKKDLKTSTGGDAEYVGIVRTKIETVTITDK